MGAQRRISASSGLKGDRHKFLQPLDAQSSRVVFLDSLQMVWFEINTHLLPNLPPCLFQATKGPEILTVSANCGVSLRPGKGRTRRLGRERAFT